MRTLLGFQKLLTTSDLANGDAKLPDSNAGPAAPPKWTVTTLFALHSWLCGNLLYKLQQADIDAVVDPRAPSRVLVDALHLYTACRADARGQGIDLEWPGMEFFLHIFGRENLFAGRKPVTPEDRIKAFNLMRSASVTTPLPASLLGRTTRSRAAIRQSRDGERCLKIRSYMALLYRDRHAISTATPLERSETHLSMIHQIAGDLATTGTVSLSFLERTGNQNFAGLPIPLLAKSLGLTPS
ncbi:hypothetical protein AMAG_04281 [Allomyces macrogynus ATCC 38327]|uniref:Uncharacterized protein n=1 Tax=Allomyces macrogynus (strain ATCC 38327) TaxID=578462 RepID=A0A0L0S7Z6_ALLM3|nr:hypothetical protein AMAG_04281 [Allomyces macrogynus ATCC 38327]|eukprot:KNE58728.1 hypothetical protein AMAG_04281 [Allomyces macrogynus ATCC 38327]